ncbi:MAG: hypothetical protein ACK5LC_13720 [Coprobacillaceae bacterium]
MNKFDEFVLYQDVVKTDGIIGQDFSNEKVMILGVPGSILDPEHVNYVKSQWRAISEENSLLEE